MTIIIPEYGTTTSDDAVRWRRPVMVHHPSQVGTLRRAQDFNVMVGEDTDVLVMVSGSPKDDARRNPGAEALLGFPVFGEAQVSSGDDWILSEEQVETVLRITSPRSTP